MDQNSNFNDDSIIRAANEAMNTSTNKQLREATEEVANVMPTMSKIAYTAYTEFKSRGFSDSQSYDFAKSYVLGLVLNK